MPCTEGISKDSSRCKEYLGSTSQCSAHWTQGSHCEPVNEQVNIQAQIVVNV